MILDVTIGVVDIQKDEYSFILGIKPCPLAQENICITRWPRESYRSGTLPLIQFFHKNLTLKIMFVNSKNADKPIPLSEFIKDINDITVDQFESEADKDRLKFIKYWSNKAVELYGDKAAIEFAIIGI